MSVSVEVYNQMQAVWATVAILLAVVPVVVVLILWFVKNYLRTKSGKTIDSTKSQHKQLVLAITPGHKADLLKTNQMIPGTLETAKFKDRASKKRKIFYEPEKTQLILDDKDLIGMENLSADEKVKALALTQECLNYMLQSNTEKVFLEDSVPLTLALADKVITTGVKGLGAFNHYEKLHKIVQLKEKVALLKQSASFRDIGDYLSGLLSQVTLINIDVLRNYFDADWNQSDDESQKEYHYTCGIRDAKKPEKGLEKWIVIGGLVMGIGGMAGGIVIALLFGKGGS
jgi:hypothetical protein